MLTNPTLSPSLSKRTIWQTLPHTFLIILLRKFSHSNSRVSLSAIIFLEQTTFGLQSQLLTLHPSCKVIPWTPELRSTDKAFIHSLMEYCSTLWAGSPASRFAHLDAVETNACKIIEISHDEAESMGLSLHHHIHIGGLCLRPHPFWSCTLCSFHASSFKQGLLSRSEEKEEAAACLSEGWGMPPPGLCRVHTVHHQTPSGESN